MMWDVLQAFSTREGCLEAMLRRTNTAEKPARPRLALTAVPRGEPFPLGLWRASKQGVFQLLSLHTGLRWSEQRALRWQDVDVLSGLITVGRSKNGASRQVPMNAVVRSMLFDLSTQRKRPNDPDELIFDGAYRTVARLFSHPVRQAQTGLRAAGKDASRLEGYTWHSNRHSFASRLVMAGVDLRTVQELGVGRR